MTSNEQCCWSQYEEEGSWETSCGDSFYLESGTPLKGGLKFCCYCGKPLVEEPFIEGNSNGIPRPVV